MHPLKGRTLARRQVALHSTKLSVPMCVSGRFIRGKKESSGFFSQTKHKQMHAGELVVSSV